MDKLAVLRQYFGFPAFRAGQQTLIDAVLSGRDALGVMPTGGGKSLCYELPALLLPGMTLVVSPLISLMEDQVMALRNAGIPAGCINSSMSLDELRETYRDARYGAYKLLYVAPERLLTGFPAQLFKDRGIFAAAPAPPGCRGLYRNGHGAGARRYHPYFAAA